MIEEKTEEDRDSNYFVDKTPKITSNQSVNNSNEKKIRL